MALVAGVFIVAPDVRMSILAMGSPMRPHTLTQTDQKTVKSYLQTGRAIRSFIALSVAAMRLNSGHSAGLAAKPKADGVDAPRRHRCARVEVLIHH